MRGLLTHLPSPQQCCLVPYCLSARILPCSSLTPRVHEHDETTVQPVRGEAPGAPARVPACTTSKSHASSCVRLSPPLRAGAGATRDARDARLLPHPLVDCGQGVHLPPHLSQSERGLSG